MNAAMCSVFDKTNFESQRFETVASSKHSFIMSFEPIFHKDTDKHNYARYKIKQNRMLRSKTTRKVGQKITE